MAYNKIMTRDKYHIGSQIFNQQRRVVRTDLQAAVGAGKVFPRWRYDNAASPWVVKQQSIEHHHGRKIFTSSNEGVDELNLIAMLPILLEHALELAVYVSELRIDDDLSKALKSTRETLQKLEGKSYYPPAWSWKSMPDGEYRLIDASKEVVLGTSSTAHQAERSLIQEGERLHRHLRSVTTTLYEVMILGSRENQRQTISIRLGSPMYWESIAEFYRLYTSNFGALPETYRTLQRSEVPNSFKR